MAIWLVVGPLAAAVEDCVVLLHGVAGTETWVWALQELLELDGYMVVNNGYPSTSADIQTLVAETCRKRSQPVGTGGCIS